MAKFPISKDYRHNSKLKAVIPRNQAVPIMSVILTLSHKPLIYASKPPSKPSLSIHLATAKRMAIVSRHHPLYPLTLPATAKRMAFVSHHHVRSASSHPFYISPLHVRICVEAPRGWGTMKSRAQVWEDMLTWQVLESWHIQRI